MTQTWAEREAEMLEQSRQERAKLDDWIGGLVAVGSMSGAVAQALVQYSEDEHSPTHGCAAHSEGQWCCLDYGHPDFEGMVGFIAKTIEGLRGVQHE